MKSRSIMLFKENYQYYQTIIVHRNENEKSYFFKENYEYYQTICIIAHRNKMKTLHKGELTIRDFINHY